MGAQYKHQLNSIWAHYETAGWRGCQKTRGCHRLWDVEFAFKILSIYLSIVSVKSDVTAQFGLFPERLLKHCSTGTLVKLQCCCNNGLGLNSRPLFATLVHMCA